MDGEQALVRHRVYTTTTGSFIDSVTSDLGDQLLVL